MKHPKVTLGLVLFKGEKYLKQALPSLLNQDYPNIEYLFRDQSPSGEAYEFIKTHLPEILKKVNFEQGENLFHSGGHNMLIRKMTGEYYFCCSYDMLYPSNLVSKVVESMEKEENKKYGSASCKLMRWDFQEIPSAGQPATSINDVLSNEKEEKSLHSLSKGKEKTNFLDSAGMGLTQSHHFFEIGQGEEDHGQYDHLKEIFGTSGALAIFRKNALDDIAYVNKSGLKEYYDERIHYKNDVDLSYRLQWAGHTCLFIPEIKVYHDRQVASKASKKSRIAGMLKSRKDKSTWVKESSVFGHLIVLKKNVEHQPFSLFVRLKTAFVNLLKFFYIIVFERHLLKQYQLVKTHEAEIADKTKKINRRINPSVIEKLMMK